MTAEGTTLETIQKVYEDQLEVINRNTDERCQFRIQTLNKRCRQFGFEKLICGMGTWTVQGPDVVFVDDGEEFTRTADEVFEWLDAVDEGDLSEPKFWVGDDNYDEPAFLALQEFRELVDWWVETTGGNDVTFNPDRAVDYLEE